MNDRATFASWLEAHKPAASSRVHRLLAASMWFAVGAGLATFGAVQTMRSAGSRAPWLFAVAIALGALKGHFILQRTARRNAARIERRGDDRCVGGFLSWRTCLLAVFMMALGRFLRHSGIPGQVLGPIYLTVGAGLVLGSLPLWRRTPSS